MNNHFDFCIFRSDRPVPASQLDNEVFDANTAPPRLKSPSQVSRTLSRGLSFLKSSNVLGLILNLVALHDLVVQDFIF